MEYGPEVAASRLPQRFQSFLGLQPAVGQHNTTMAKSLEVLLPQVVSGSRHLAYYLTIAAVLVAIWLIQAVQSRRRKQVVAPFYKAGLLKWMFDAENLIVDSYNKVRGANGQVLMWQLVNTLAVPRQGLPNQGDGRCPSINPAKTCWRDQGISGGHPQRQRSRG